MKFTQRKRKRGRPNKNANNFSAHAPLSPLSKLKTMSQSVPKTNSKALTTSSSYDESLEIDVDVLGSETLTTEFSYDESLKIGVSTSSSENENELNGSQQADEQAKSSVYELGVVREEMLNADQTFPEIPLTLPPSTSIKLSTTIHLIDGEKGGCGKSFLSRSFIEYCNSIGLDIAIVDADTSNKDIAKIYPQVRTAFFSDDEKLAQQADKIFDLAFEKSVIVNLPAQVYTNVTQWIQRNDLIELGKENSITFIKWFVCSGGVDSVNFFLKSLEDLGDKMTHVFVQNMGLCDDWSYIEQMPEFVAAQNKYNFTVIDFPKFPFWERNKVDRLEISFESAIAHHELGVISKQRVKNFLKSAYAAFKETRLVR
ncbi:MAG: cobalamin biosynthesis protein CobQ [Pelatocladus maniniholoensis HA4357-MV3]|jgi:hypothetical protein|uniref:Cobalamin biosynthesis protein CobQ n=1 Tax=Pelatocladus maniniholoensis HA4357-MV3 TaxID=1117104 RepID=A0A9E3H3T7_9NOST|nr:cobalamin biosynthesis protein CobQ [Pelatocladus maniniholoensis HA4357-MV3]